MLIFQLLACDLDFVSSLLSIENAQSPWFCEFQQVIGSLRASADREDLGGKCFDIRRLLGLNPPQFQGLDQQCILDFKEATLRLVEASSPGASQHMTLTFQNIVTCSVCGCTRLPEQTSGDMYLHSGGEPVTLQQALDSALLSQIPNAECLTCRENTQHTQKTVLVNKHRPNTVFVYISCFDQDLTKLPVNITLDQEVILHFNGKPETYQVAAMIEHVGEGRNTGHYIAWVQPNYCENRGSWVKVNDHVVTQEHPPALAGHLLMLKAGASLELGCVHQLVKELAGSVQMVPVVEITAIGDGDMRWGVISFECNCIHG